MSDTAGGEVEHLGMAQYLFYRHTEPERAITAASGVRLAGADPPVTLEAAGSKEGDRNDRDPIAN